MEQQIRHRAGALKQQNKLHRHGKHRSKGSLEALNKGRVQTKSNIRKFRPVIRKVERRNQADQLRRKKRDEYLKQVRGIYDAPFLVGLVSLSDNINYFDILKRIREADSEAVITYAEKGYTHIIIPRFKQRFTFVAADTKRIYHTLDLLKVVDSVLFLTSVEGISEDADLIMACIVAQGLPNYTISLVDVQSIPVKKRHEAKLDIQKLMSQWLPEEKIAGLESQSDIMTLFRIIGTQKQKPIIQRDRRSHILAERTEYVKSENGEEGWMKIYGYVRGLEFSVNDLVHIPGWGDFKLHKMESLADPHNRRGDGEVIGEAIANSEEQESLQSENIPDPLDAEQTWPTEEELKLADEANSKKVVKRVPKGFSEYQAAWIPDCDAEELSDVEDEEDEEIEEDEASDEHEMDFDKSETTTVTFDIPMEIEQYDKTIDMEEERQIQQKLKDANSEKMFPDEVDTPLDTPARIRFQKYRGLKSLRTSPWDPKENLPADYARIFQFENFLRTKKRIINNLDEKIGFEVGSYVALYVDGITENEYSRMDTCSTLVVFAMLPHEQKMSVINMMLKRPNISQEVEPIKSKEELIFQCGYRRFKSCPIFSEHSKGNVCKYERFFQPDSTVIATTYANIIFPPATVLAFKEQKDSSLELVATGNVLSVNPDRIVVKRTILSGHPLKVHKKSAVIRFMFYNREDIEWFKPIELKTKYGRRGHIKEPLGTHGHMKCIFDGPIKSQDTVLLPLYKRIFPKWTFNNLCTILHNEF